MSYFVAEITVSSLLFRREKNKREIKSKKVPKEEQGGSRGNTQVCLQRFSLNVHNYLPTLTEGSAFWD